MARRSSLRTLRKCLADIGTKTLYIQARLALEGRLLRELQLETARRVPWKCPHCAFVHTAADLMRLDSTRFQGVGIL